MPLLLLLLACRGADKTPDDSSPLDSAPDDSGDSADDSEDTGDSSPDSGDTDDSGDSGDTTDSGDDLVIPEDNIANVLGDCRGKWREPDEYGNQLIAGDELHRHTLDDPQAVCNDGTRAVMFVRPYTDEALRDDWEIHLQGGGGCGSWEDCALRYCGLGYYDQSKMSSDWAPEDVGAVGIMDSGSANLVSGANHVYFYYCSSDGWTGTGQVTYTPTSEEFADWPAYTMFERGHTILEAGLAELQAGVVSDGGLAMPRLSDARVVLLNGTSAGSNGARANADWVREELAPNGTRVVAIFDAANDPPVNVLPPSTQEKAVTMYQGIWASAQAGRDYTPWMDQSCLDQHGGTEDEYLCWVDSFVIRNHVTTPFFVRQDFQDTTGAAEALGLPIDEYEAYTRAGLANLVDVPATALEEVTVTPGAYGPNCAQHVALETDDWWRVATVEDDAGTEWTFQDAVLGWAAGRVQAVLDEAVVGEGTGPRSHCAAADDER